MFYCHTPIRYGPAMDTTIQIETEFIALAAALKLAGAVGSGGEAKHLIRVGLVQLNGKPEMRRGAKVRPGDAIVVDADPPLRIAVVASGDGTPESTGP